MVDTEPTVLSDKELAAIITGEAPFITTKKEGGILPAQIQPSSLDLTLGRKVFGMGVASLPRDGGKVSELVKGCQYSFTLNANQNGFLHRGYTYIVCLNEQLALPKGFSAKFSPKSSTGRTDVFVRVLADGISRFDHVPDWYQGNLYLEITPLSFPILIRSDLSLVQMRIRTGDARLSGKDVALMHSHKGIFLDKESDTIPMHELKQAEYGIYLHVDLDRDIVGFASRSNVTDALSLCKSEANDPLEYWEPIKRPQNWLTLDRDRFYLLATKERIRIPTNLCADIAPYDASTGEFRTHYAGFFDPGFGGEKGITGVLEVRGREIPHRLFDNDPVCLMIFERVGAVACPYQGHYQNLGPSLSKHFKNRYEVWDV
jgi:dCTP deaminase